MSGAVKWQFFGLVLILGGTACSREKLEFIPSRGVEARGQLTRPLKIEWVETQAATRKQAVFSGRAIFRGALSSVIIRNLFPEGAELERLDPRASRPLFRLRFTLGKPVSEVLELLNNERSIEWAEPDYLIEAHAAIGTVAAAFDLPRPRDIPSDPDFLKSWSLANFGQSILNGIEGKPGADIHWLEAIKIAGGSKEVMVGVLDTGVDYLHPDLRENVYSNNPELRGSSGKDDDGNGFIDDVSGWDFANDDADPMDENGHGTHTAGIIGASRNNGVGSAGICDRVSILPLKVLNRDGSGSVADAYRAIQYAIRLKVHVLSSSWGGAPDSKLLKSAVEDAGEAGVLYVRSAGNEGSNLDLRAESVSAFNEMVIGASDAQDRRASFSNYGEKRVDLFAPGVNIYSTGLSKDGKAAYRLATGTSAAVPHVTGVAALLMGEYRGLRFQPAILKKRILETADLSLSFDGRSASGGRMNLFRALKNDLNIPEKKDWTEEDHLIRSPSFPLQMTDFRKTVQVEGATAIRIHFRFINIDRPYDAVAVYDGKERLVYQAEFSQQDNFWTPPIEGDRATVRFVNARVKKGHAGAVVGKSFVNYQSEGFAIDKVAHLKGNRE